MFGGWGGGLDGGSGTYLSCFPNTSPKICWFISENSSPGSGVGIAMVSSSRIEFWFVQTLKGLCFSPGIAFLESSGIASNPFSLASSPVYRRRRRLSKERFLQHQYYDVIDIVKRIVAVVHVPRLLDCARQDQVYAILSRYVRARSRRSPPVDVLYGTLFPEPCYRNHRVHALDLVSPNSVWCDPATVLLLVTASGPSN